MIGSRRIQGTFKPWLRRVSSLRPNGIGRQIYQVSQLKSLSMNLLCQGHSNKSTRRLQRKPRPQTRRNCIPTKGLSQKENPIPRESRALGKGGGLERVVYVSRSFSPRSVSRQNIYQKACNLLLQSSTSPRILRREDYFDLANAKALPNTYTKDVCSPGVTQTPTRSGITGNVQHAVSAIAWRG